MTNDMTFCMDTECKRKSCMRHQHNIIGQPQYISVADFKNTTECPDYKPTAPKKLAISFDYLRLRPHIGHNIVCVCYGEKHKDPVNIAIECETCNEVLYSADKYQEE